MRALARSPRPNGTSSISSGTRTNVPRGRSTVTRPSVRSCAMACRTVVRLMPYSCASRSSLGNGSPGPSSPDSIWSRSRSASWRKTARSAEGSIMPATVRGHDVPSRCTYRLMLLCYHRRAEKAELDRAAGGGGRRSRSRPSPAQLAGAPLDRDGEPGEEPVVQGRGRPGTVRLEVGGGIGHLAHHVDLEDRGEPPELDAEVPPGAGAGPWVAAGAADPRRPVTEVLLAVAAGGFAVAAGGFAVAGGGFAVAGGGEEIVVSHRATSEGRHRPAGQRRRPRRRIMTPGAPDVVSDTGVRAGPI